MGFPFFFNSLMLGVGLAMDAFSVSLANGLNNPCMRVRRMSLTAGVFALFQFAMPLIGWFCVRTVATYFTAFEACIPWIALLLLGFIGGKMLVESIHSKDCGCDEDKPAVGFGGLLVQGVATSIDALSVGFTISEYGVWEALLSCSIIGCVTFLICMLGLAIGRRAGTALAGKAGILGGSILILIGIEIFLTGLFGG